MKLPRKKNEKSAQSRALIPFCAQEPANSRRTTRPGLALNVASKAGTAALPFSRAGFVAVSGAYVTKVVCRSMGPIDKVSLKKCEVFRTSFWRQGPDPRAIQLGKTLGVLEGESADQAVSDRILMRICVFERSLPIADAADSLTVGWVH